MRKLVFFSVLIIAALALCLEPLFLQPSPSVTASQPPSPQDVVAARSLFRNIRASTQDPTGARLLLTDTAQLNSAMRLGARFVRRFRGQVALEGNALRGEVSLPVPWWRGDRWLNLSGSLPVFDGTPALQGVTVGATSLPPALAIGLARHGANLVIGDRFGDKLLGAARAMRISQNQITFQLALDDIGKNGLMQGAFGTLRGSPMPGPEEIETYHQRILAAMADGRLAQTGSFLPYIRFTLAVALEDSTPAALPNSYTAAVFGLAKACGTRGFAEIVGRLAFDVAEFSESWQTNCDAVTLNDRIDSRLHFITSAALQAASNRGFSVAVGEFKELYDTISGAGGFDFTDMAANLSGVRLSNVMMETPRAQWPALLARLETEDDVMVPFDGIPQLVADAEFSARFRDIDSPAYREMISRIETRIDGLDLHRTP